VFGLKPAQIISSLKLLRPIYEPTSSYGHFGRKPGKNGEFSWEATNQAKALQSACK